MSGNPFSKPAAASGIQWEDHKGQLLLIEPKGIEANVSTTYGDKDAVRADITILDAPDGPVEFADALIFPGVLISQTRSKVNEKVLGRLGQGQAKQGQKPPWRLDEVSDADVEVGKEYLEKRNNSNPFSAPAQEKNPPF